MTTASSASKKLVKSCSKRLINKILWFAYDSKSRRNRTGFYAGRIVKVEIVKRVTKRTAHLKVGDIRSITVALSDSYTLTYTGQRIKLRPCEWQRQSAGVLYRTKFIEPEELLQ